MPPKRGRPQQFTAQQQQKLLEHIAQGATTEDAARIVGVSLRTVQRQARYNEFFQRNLQLALSSPPSTPQTLIQHAARTHWRAAAWLLERTDPDNYSKRPANSCSPAKLLDVMAFLIETALEATPEESRADVYRRMRDAADKLFDLMMPHQRDRASYISEALAARPMPLSDRELLAQMRDPADRPYRPPLVSQQVHDLLGPTLPELQRTKPPALPPGAAAQALLDALPPAPPRAFEAAPAAPAPAAPDDDHGGARIMSPEIEFCDKNLGDRKNEDKRPSDRKPSEKVAA